MEWHKQVIFNENEITVKHQSISMIWSEINYDFISLQYLLPWKCSREFSRYLLKQLTFSALSKYLVALISCFRILVHCAFVTSYFKLLDKISTRFFISNTRLKIVKNQAKDKQHPSMLSSKSNLRYS